VIFSFAGHGSGGYVHEFDRRRRERDFQTILPEPFKMKFNRLLDQGNDLVSRFRRRNTPGQVGHVCTETPGALFNDYCVTHCLLLLHVRLPENHSQGAIMFPTGHPGLWMPGHF